MAVSPPAVAVVVSLATQMSELNVVVSLDGPLQQ